MRWTARRKAEVIRRLRIGDITRDQALAQHGISSEELDAWLGLNDVYGAKALRATYMQAYR